jgi:hypothetical protein
MYSRSALIVGLCTVVLLIGGRVAVTAFVHHDVVSFLMQSFVFSNTQEATFVYLPDTVAVYVLHGSCTF